MGAMWYEDGITDLGDTMCRLDTGKLMAPITQDELNKAQHEVLEMMNEFSRVKKVPPAGAITKEMVMEDRQCSDRTADKLLAAAVSAGKLDSGLFSDGKGSRKKWWWKK